MAFCITCFEPFKRMADGKVSVAYSSFLGYDRGADGGLVVNPKEAEIVRLIFRSFMDGMTPIGICHMLEERGVLTPMKKKKWSESTVLSILQNEKYRGDALLQKTFTVDFLTKKHKVNEGEIPQYYVRGNHEAIIPPSDFEKAQAELARRRSIGRGYSGGSVFASRIICGDCGGFYGKKVWHSNDPYRRVIWRCNRKYGNGEKCETPTLDEETIKELFLKAYNLLMADRESIAEDCRVIADLLGDTAALDERITAAQKETADVVSKNSAFIHSHKASGDSLAEFEKITTEYDDRYQKAEARLEKLQAERQERLARKQAVERFIDDLLQQPLVLEQWDDQMWNLLVQKMVVSGDGTAVFEFKGENKITVRIE